ncbi:MAG: SRPBCC domain-containing protein [Pseudolabrys sp.]|nr:SRPBCC domain-containing protein [Pseudolabrys sp.]
MIDTSNFKPKTTYAIYIDAPANKVWQGLTEPEFTKRYFAGFAAAIEPKVGGVFRLLAPDGPPASSMS